MLEDKNSNEFETNTEGNDGHNEYSKTSKNDCIKRTS